MSAQTVLFDAPGPRARRRYQIVTVLGGLLTLAVLAVVVLKLADTGQLAPSLWTPFLTPSAWVNYLIPGLIGTLQATFFSVILAGVFGLLFGVGRLSEHRAVRWLCGVVVEFFRAVPVLVMMIFVFFTLAPLGWFPASTTPLIAVVTALTVYNGSVIAELVRSGVQALPKGQREAGLSVGLTAGQVMRTIQLPQALVAMLPALIGQLVVVLKDSALGYMITYTDLLNWAKTLGSAYANTVPAYLVAALLFIVLNYAITRLAMFVERRLSRTRRTAGPVTTAAPNIIQGTAEPGIPSAAEVDAFADFVHEHPRGGAAPDADPDAHR